MCVYTVYNGKVWLEESLANLLNHLQFTKLKPKHSPHQTFPLYTIHEHVDEHIQ